MNMLAFCFALLLLPQAKKFDVVVYGGTAGGVVTAVAAARGFFNLWEAEPERAVLRGEAVEWFDKLGIRIWDRGRPLETLDWPVLAKWLGRELPQGQRYYVLRHELARVIYEMGK